MMKFKHSRLILMTVVLIIVSFLLTTALSVHSLHTVIKGNNEELSKVLAAQIYDSINNRLSEPIAVAQTMASDHFLMESMENEDFPNEEEAKQVVSYLSKLSTRMNYSSASLFPRKVGNIIPRAGSIRLWTLSMMPMTCGTPLLFPPAAWWIWTWIRIRPMGISGLSS